MDRSSIAELDREYVWRPFCSLEDHQSKPPLVVAQAEGSFVYDADGRRFFDATSAWWSQVLGFRHPRLVAALQRQADTLPHAALADATHESAALLAAELARVAPKGDRKLSRVFYSDDGSTAVEVALKIAFQFHAQNGRAHRDRFLSFTGAYHGDTVGAMSVGHADAFTSVFRPLLFPAVADHADAVLRALRKHSDRIAAVIVEPLVQGANGMQMYPPEVLTALREECDRCGALLIADEVFTGFGRTGTMWACEQAAVVPDLLCTAKGLSGGLLPFAATLATDTVYDGFRGGMSRAFLHGHTFTGNPLGAAVAREVLAIFREEAILEHLPARITRIEQGFAALAAKGLRNVRQRGMVAAGDVGTASYLDGQAGRSLARSAFERGILLRPLGDVVYLVPPLNVALADLDFFFEGMTGCLDDSPR